MGIRQWFEPFNRLINVMNAIGTLGIFAIMILIVADVFMRSVLSTPLVGVPEIVKLSIVAIVFLQAAHTLAVGRFTASDMFLIMVEARSNIVASVLRSAFMLAGSALFTFVAVGAYDQLTYAYESGDFVGSQGIFTLPVWPMHAVILVGSVALALQFTISAILVWEPATDVSHDASAPQEHIKNASEHEVPQ